MFKIGQKATHYAKADKVGEIIDIEYLKNSFYTTGGTTASKIFITIKYSEKDIQKHDSGDVIKVYD
ncbi:hypothetical protein CL614_09255 [archaeon]|nr:hypothetical protein [archaeon]|tara:strand:- start:1962 stop:2159 length:198 start_codon:yes stop_codon:yes gene_type:complete